MDATDAAPTPPAAPASDSAPTKPWEEWALAKGLAKLIPEHAPAGAAAARKNIVVRKLLTWHWTVNAARMHAKWTDPTTDAAGIVQKGTAVTEAEFNAAVKAMAEAK